MEFEVARCRPMLGADFFAYLDRRIGAVVLACSGFAGLLWVCWAAPVVLGCSGFAGAAPTHPSVGSRASTASPPCARRLRACCC